jgi:predicted metalloprotease with PDZ domain
MSTTLLAIPRHALPVALLSCLSACAGTTTQQASLPPGAVEAEKEKQLELVLSEHQKQQARLDEITYRILATGTSLCNEDRGKRLGLTLATVHDYPRPLQPVAVSALGVSDTLTILSLPSSGPAARAGLKIGDQLIATGATAIQQGPGAAKHFAKLIAD